jgi:hypothetical protein
MRAGTRAYKQGKNKEKKRLIVFFNYRPPADKLFSVDKKKHILFLFITTERQKPTTD